MPVKQYDAIILGLDINGLGVVRSLSKFKLRLLGIYRHDSEIGRLSKYCTAYKMHRKDGDVSSQLVALLLNIKSQQVEKPVVFATSDYYVKFLNDYREMLEKHFLYSLPDKKLLDKILTKAGQYQLAREYNIAMPETYILDNCNDLYKKRNDIKFPCIVKPMNSFSNILPSGTKNVIFDSYQELEDFIKNNAHIVNHLVIQEIIQGGDESVCYCTMYFNKESEPVGAFTAQKIRQYKPDYGITCFAKSKKIEEILTISVNFLKKLQYRGLIDIEYIYDKRDGLYKFIEMNPRTHWANSHSTMCGINLPYILYSDLKNTNYNKLAIGHQKDGIKWVYLRSDIASFIYKRRTGHLQWIPWLKSLLSVKSFACFNIYDPVPCIYDTYNLLKEFIRKGCLR